MNISLSKLAPILEPPLERWNKGAVITSGDLQILSTSPGIEESTPHLDVT